MSYVGYKLFKNMSYEENPKKFNIANLFNEE